MTDTAYAQQQAIQSRREVQKPLKGWAHLSCPNPRCCVWNLFVEVEEDVDRRPLQAPCKCVRCQVLLVWEGWKP